MKSAGKKISKIIKPGNNCWHVAEADQAWIIFDADNYFSSLYTNLCLAKKQILFLGWDFDSRLELVRSPGEVNPDVPIRFGKLLKHLAKTVPGIEIFILAWDFATLYLPMREMFQKLKFTGVNIKFIFDGQHPLGSAHHQKIVVIDDALAYCGGLDITSSRWDTVKHRIYEPKRSNHGNSYPPFHDMMVALTGNPAFLLGNIARERIFRATGESVTPPKPAAEHAAKFSINGNSYKHINVCISRTIPLYRDFEEIREVEALYCDQIHAAENYIYIENQYLTAPIIVEALKESLQNSNGPYILIILPENQSDQMSRLVIRGLEAQAFKDLRSSDRHHRLYIGYPHAPGLKENQFENIHSKLISIDDEQIRIGSANLNNRSMGLDTECDITFLAKGDPHLQEKFRHETAKMIAHHYVTNWRQVLKTWESVSLDFRKLIEILNRENTRQLREFNIDSSPLQVTALINFAEQDSPSRLEKAADRLLAKGFKDDVGFFYRVVPVGFISTIVFALLIASTNMKVDYSESYFPISLIMGQQEPTFLGFCLIGALGFLLSSVMLIPFPLLIVWSIACIGAPSIVFITLGSLLSTVSGFLVGRMLGNRPQKLPGRWLPMVNEKMRSGGFWSIFWTRAYPFAPFTLISLLAGRNRTDFKTFFTASIAGVLPYLVTVFFLQLRLLSYVERPSVKNGLILFAIIFACIYFIRIFQRRFTLNVSHSSL